MARGGSARKRKEREKGQWEKECKIKRVKEGLYKQKKSQLHTGRKEDREKKHRKTKISKKKRRGWGAREEKNCLQSQRGRSERERQQQRRRRERKKEDIWRKRAKKRVEEEESVRARGDQAWGSPLCRDTCADLIKSTPASHISTLLPGHLPDRSEREREKRS